MSKLQSVDGMFGPVTTEALRHVTLTDADKAAVLLARRYASAIDDAEDRDAALAQFGPRLLSVLDALRATPKARGAAKAAPARAGKLQALRSGRTA